MILRMLTTAHISHRPSRRRQHRLTHTRSSTRATRRTTRIDRFKITGIIQLALPRSRTPPYQPWFLSMRLPSTTSHTNSRPDRHRCPLVRRNAKMTRARTPTRTTRRTQTRRPILVISLTPRLLTSRSHGRLPWPTQRRRTGRQPVPYPWPIRSPMKPST